MEQGGKCPESEVDAKKDNHHPCSISPCLGGGSCESHDGTFTCYCLPGRTGKFCEKVVKRADIVTAGFTGQSFVLISSPKYSGPRTSVRIKFKPHSRDGVILFSSLDSDQVLGNLSLSLVEGHVQLRYHEDDRQITLQSSSIIHLGYWHSLTLHTYHGDVMMQVEGEEPIVATFKQGKIAGLGGSVYIGGVTAESSENFRGCLADLTVGHHPVSLVSPVEPALREAVGIVDCENLPCSDSLCGPSEDCYSDGDKGEGVSAKCEHTPDLCHPNPCQGGGQCVRQGRDTFQCLCKSGRGGRLCDSSLMDIMMADQADHEDLAMDKVMEFDGRRLVKIMNRGERRSFSERRNEFEFEMRTVDKNGVMVSVSGWHTAFARDLFEISLVDGRIEVRVKIGSDVGVGVSRGSMNTGKWRRVWVGRRERRVMVKIMGKESFSFNIGDLQKNKKRRRTSFKSDGFICLGKLTL